MAFTVHQIASYGQTADSLGAEGGHRLLRDSLGNLIAVGVDSRVGSKLVLYVSSDGGANWSTEDIIDLSSSSRSVTGHPNFVLDNVDTLHIVFKAMNSISGWDEVCYISGYSANWGSLTVLATPEVMNVSAPDVCITDGDIYALWLEEGVPNYDVVLRMIGGSNSVITTAANIGSGSSIIAGAAAGELHAIWFADPDADYSMALVYGYFDGATWDFTEFDPDDTGLTPQPFTGNAKILLDDSGTVHIFCVYYSNPDYLISLFHYYNAGAGWIGPSLIRSEATGVMFALGNPTFDSVGDVYLPISRCDLATGDLDPPGSMLVYKYSSSTWTIAETFVCDANYIARGASLIAPSNVNEGFVGVFDYGNVTDAYNWTVECDPTCIAAEIIVSNYLLEFFYDGQSHGNTDSATIFLPLVTDEFIYKLIGLKNTSGSLIQGVDVSATALHGTVMFATGSAGDTETDGKMKSYSENVFTPSIANGATEYVWLRWRNTTPRYAGSNTIQLTNVVY